MGEPSIDTVTATYNEIDSYAADWISNLASAGHVAPGRVDTRSITELTAEDVRHVAQAHFFAGIAVWSAAARAAGWPDDAPLWTGSCPCQPFSQAGRGKGTKDARHLWPEWFRLIRECMPPVIVGEQVASPAGLGWLDTVFADLEGAGYACAAADLCAAGVGAPHQRQRLYFVAITLHGGTRNVDVASGKRRPRREGAEVGGLDDRSATRRQEGPHGPVGVHETGATRGFWSPADWLPCRDGKYRPVEPGTFPLAHGATARVGRLRAYGNAIVQPQAQAFLEAVIDMLTATDEPTTNLTKATPSGRLITLLLSPAPFA